MTWNYRIILHDDEAEQWFGLHEVYERDGKLSWTDNPISFVCDLHAAEIIKSLEMALTCARMHPVLVISEVLRSNNDA